ncbi:MAG: exodeoxyribonuclease I [Rectinema sp.]|jgi:exodeoxyribonuclease-1|uniref:Exodeoxyribonuclease I n=1 Tax=uncultured spirochete TaxID=156406 RepID=A0A3P3XRJ3_9SPIR|nr:Exodeoxyribonuclease I [uncultured spirochete]
MPATILWYDLETFGRDPQHDRIAQCAFIRTDEALEEVGPPLVLYCRLPPDYLPDPEACYIHGITPQEVEQKGLSEYEFALRVMHEMSVPNTTVAGYNSIQFDDEFIRRLFYRNLLDPYTREYRNDNSRWDVINLLRAVHDLKHEGFHWPANADGNPSFRLEELAKANGIAHENAHDALFDVRATIGLARKVRTAYPRLYQWYFQHRRRENLTPLVNLSLRENMLVHTSQLYTRANGCSTVITPLGLIEADRHALVAYDLRFSPGPFSPMSEDELRDLLFTERLENGPARPPITMIRLNSCPYLAPVNVLNKQSAKRLKIDIETCRQNLLELEAVPGMKERLIAAYRYEKKPLDELDPEYALYGGGFYPDEDRRELDRFHEVLQSRGPHAAKNEFLRVQFRDSRILTLMGRLLARNFPETLTAEQHLSWRKHAYGWVQLPLEKGATALADYARLEEQLREMSAEDPHRRIASALLEWKEKIEKFIREQ